MVEAVARGAWEVVLELVFPQFCKQCGERLFERENGFFCLTCWEEVPRIAAPYCTQCGKPHPGMIGFGVQLRDWPCAECRESPNKHITMMRGAVVYTEAAELAIKLLKFHGRRRAAGPLAGLMMDFATREMNPGDYTRIVPVPLHPVRERERGFNQSALLAEAVLPAFPNARLDTQLRRIRPTMTQSRLTAEARRKNVRGAFAYLGEDLAGAQVLLIDDVVTTSGTVTECARILKKAGAGRVDVLAAALAVKMVDLG